MAISPLSKLRKWPEAARKDTPIVSLSGKTGRSFFHCGYMQGREVHSTKLIRNAKNGAPVGGLKVTGLQAKKNTSRGGMTTTEVATAGAAESPVGAKKRKTRSPSKIKLSFAYQSDQAACEGQEYKADALRYHEEQDSGNMYEACKPFFVAEVQIWNA